jgi:hypothetical protein
MHERIPTLSSAAVVHHKWTPESIRRAGWFTQIEMLEGMPGKNAKCGLHMAWKPFVIRDALLQAAEGDLVLYLDSPRYYDPSKLREGIDAFVKACVQQHVVVGGITHKGFHNHEMGLADLPHVWEHLNGSRAGDRSKHARVAFITATKTPNAFAFLDDWCLAMRYDTMVNGSPVCTLYRCPEQGPCNIVIHKHPTIVCATNPDFTHHDWCMFDLICKAFTDNKTTFRRP